MSGVASNIGLGCALALISLCGCSTATQVAAGPLVASSSRGEGAEVLTRAASGLSSERGFSGLEAAGRAFSLGEGQGLSVGLGPAWFGKWGKHWYTFDADAMLGIANIRHRPWALGTFRAALGAGVELTSSSSSRSQRLLFGGEPMPGMIELSHHASVLTIDVGPTLDVSEAWSPLFSIGVRVGIAWIEQRYSVEAPAWPRPGIGVPLLPPARAR